jgi:sugar lactone lactonase YvrE
MRDPLVNEPTDDGKYRMSFKTADMTNFAAIVFRLDPDLSLHRMIEKATVPNGTSWSPDGKTMYIVDSPTKNVYAYDYDIDSGSISNRRVFFHVEDEAGVPDGHAIDAEGCIWQAIFGCGKVVRISPDGKILAEVKLPTRCVTCPAFAGEDLFITTHEEVDPDKYPESVKMQGDLFRVHVGIRGLPRHKFKL